MGKVFLLLGDPTEREQSGGRGRGDRNRAGDGSGGREDPDRRPSGGGGPGVGTGGGRGDSGNRAQMQTWVYTPNEALGIPNGLTVRFRSQQNLGFRIIQSDELEEALERSKTRFIRNPSINYELNADGRLMKLEGRADPNSPAKLILQEFRDTRMATEDIRFEPDFAFFQSNRGDTYIAILLSVDGTPLTWNDNEAAVEIFYSIEDADGFPISQTEEPVTLAQSQQGPVTVELPIQLRPGDYTVYFGIRDVGTETYGTQILAAIIAVEGTLPVNIMFLAEGEVKWTPFFRPGVKVVKQACSMKKGAEKSEEKSYEAQPCFQGESCLGGTTRAGDSGGTIPAAQGSREPDLQVEAAAFGERSRVLSRPKRWAEAMPRCARPNCSRKSGS